ncbi:Hsp70-like protein [Phytophthora palmivora]|uniref:Hsp70-like protein n=1 Tax=Phytophthora palmivora TaxID=4796 RepID=A0A2P4YUP0_9STRA|nr:Hsp70-like protein [Phytophthora palmivora]
MVQVSIRQYQIYQVSFRRHQRHRELHLAVDNFSDGEAANEGEFLQSGDEEAFDVDVDVSKADTNEFVTDVDGEEDNSESGTNLALIFVFIREDAQGAVPRGTFGKFMPRHRFEEIIRYLHFSDNDAAGARNIETWKIQTVADAINSSFATGMTVGPRLAFDEEESHTNGARDFTSIAIQIQVIAIELKSTKVAHKEIGAICYNLKTLC